MTIAVESNSDGSGGTLYVNGVKSFKYGADNSGQLAAFRNKIINGDGRIAQRGLYVLNQTPNTWWYGADRMVSKVVSTGTMSASATKWNGMGTSSNYAAGLASVSISGGGEVWLGQRIESVNCYDLNASQVTVSVTLWQNTGSTQPLIIYLYKPQTTANNWLGTPVEIAASTTFNIPNVTNTRISYTFTLGLSDATNGLAVYFAYRSLGTISPKEFSFGDIQLEKGSIATPFEVKPYGIEFAACERYYEQSTPSYYATFFNGDVTNGNVYGSSLVNFRTPKYRNPDVTLTNVGNSGFPATVGTVFYKTITGFIEGRTASATSGTAIFGSSYIADAEIV